MTQRNKHTNSMRSVLVSGATLVALAGLPLSTAMADGPGHTKTAATAQDTLTLRSCDKIDGMTVQNPNGEDIGVISDVLVRRGSGEFSHVILKTDAVLGLGGRETAVPYSAFQWTSDGPVLEATPEQIEQLAEFNPEEWQGLAYDSWTERTGEFVYEINREFDMETSDPYAEGAHTAQTKKFSGEIERVERHRTATGEEFVTIYVSSEKGTTPIVLGPSWFVMSGKSAPMRGYSVEGAAFDIRGESMVAQSIQFGGDTIRLRASDGEALWTPSLNADRQAKKRRSEHARFVLLSDLENRPVVCRGATCGDVSDVLFDSRSGRIAFLAIDPDQNFLGIGDTTRLVPWNIVNVPVEGRIRIDASREMVLNSAEEPDELSSLNASHKQIYAAFDVREPEFKPVKRQKWINASNLGGWSEDSKLAKALENGRDMKIRGEAVKFVTKQPCDGVSPGQAIVIRTSDGDEKTIFLGPVWFAERRVHQINRGDAIEFQATACRLDGNERIVARSMNIGGERIELWNGAPAWDQN